MLFRIIRTLFVVTLAVGCLLLGVFLECKYSEVHFARSGALLVVLALVVAGFRERSAVINESRFLSSTLANLDSSRQLGDAALLANLYDVKTDFERRKLDDSRQVLQKAGRSLNEQTPEQKIRYGELEKNFCELESQLEEMIKDKQENDKTLPAAIKSISDAQNEIDSKTRSYKK